MHRVTPADLHGTVEAVFLAASGTAAPVAVAEAEAVPGRGLRGDRYFEGSGTFWAAGKNGQDLTLIGVEALDALRAEAGIELDPAAARRNVLTRGIDLNALVGVRFRVGEVECQGQRLCDPCAHLQRVTEPGVLRGLADRGGLRADVLTAGRIRPGDVVLALP
jgi:MOSC domain-containing protein YiiM